MCDDPHVAVGNDDRCEPLACFVIGVHGGRVAGTEASRARSQRSAIVIASWGRARRGAENVVPLPASTHA
jgi:hypothetical protein